MNQQPSALTSTFLGRVLAAVLTLALLAIGIMFSLVVFAVVAIAGGVGLCVWWWKTRHLRQSLREGQPPNAPDDSVIEGEAVVINVERK